MHSCLLIVWIIILDSKEIKPVNPKGNQPWKCIGRTDAEAKAPILWPLDEKSWLIGKDPDAGKDWGQEKKGMTGRDGWMASPTQWTWDWVSSRSWWWTGKPGMLQSMGLQKVGKLTWWVEFGVFILMLFVECMWKREKVCVCVCVCVCVYWS